ncbi:hypothetical protein [Arthrospira platensis]|uniref:hypothetical protein n=1 Tax=Limnospira platensis TaxID=118562 RepID=UPI001EDAB6D6
MKLYRLDKAFDIVGVGEGEGNLLVGWGEEDAIFALVKMGYQSGFGEVGREGDRNLTTGW